MSDLCVYRLTDMLHGECGYIPGAVVLAYSLEDAIDMLVKFEINKERDADHTTPEYIREWMENHIENFGLVKREIIEVDHYE